MKLKFLLIALFTVAMGFAQNGTVTGTITDKDMGSEPLPFANINVKGTTIATNADENGKYTISVPAGTQTLVFSFLGYEPLETQVTVIAGETQTIDKTLESTSVKLADVVIEQTVNREKESTLLADQKKAIEMKQAIGAQELYRKGVNDAAGAVLKTSGISKSEGVNNVFVRGLGDRYNSTTLNGLPLPSEDPIYKNISLDFFGTNIIKNININKTFNAGLYGDVAGANIDITSKELDTKSIFAISAKSGVNSSAIGANNFAVADKAYSYFGSLQNGRNAPISDLTQLSFKSDFKTQSVNNPVNSAFNIVGGGKFNVGENKTLTLFGVATNTSNYSFQKGMYSQATDAGMYVRQMKLQRSEYDATQTFLGNVKYKFGKGSISANSLYIHDNKQYVANLLGFDRGINDSDTPDAQKSIISRQQNNNNILFSNQVIGDYKFSNHVSANGGFAYNTMRGTEPDRKNNEYAYKDASQAYFLSNDSPGDNSRFFSKLDENDFTAKAEVNYTINPDDNLPAVVTVGGNYRDTDRTFDFIQFNYRFTTPPIVDPNNPDLVFNQANLDLTANNGSKGFNLVTDRGGANNSAALDPFYYTANRKIGAGYAKISGSINEKFTAQVGVRVETFKQNIDWDTNISSSVNDPLTKPTRLNQNFVLPSFTLKYDLNEKNTLRFAASKTYTMPQFKETAPFLYSNINNSEYGNPYLKASTDYNIDAKYDIYPSKNEVFSIGGFYKYIQDPISRIQVASAGNEYSYVNTEKAFVAGAEIELRKNILSYGSDVRNTDFSFGLNASYLYSEQTQNDSSEDQLTVLFKDKKGKMQGASPLLVNADLSYNTSNEQTSLLSTVVVNYFYDKVYAVGAFTQSTMEKAVPTLDFINKFELKKYKMGITVGLMNLLNPKYKLTMDTVKDTALISSYRKGSVFSLAVNWRL